MPTETNSHVETIEEVAQDDGESVPVANDGTYSATVTDGAIDTNGELFRLDTRGKTILEIAVDATEATDYALDASTDGETWFNGFATFSATASIRETFDVGVRYVRLRVTSAASADSTANGLMEAS